MKFLSSIAALAAGAGLAWGQAPITAVPPSSQSMAHVQSANVMPASFGPGPNDYVGYGPPSSILPPPISSPPSMMMNPDLGGYPPMHGGPMFPGYPVMGGPEYPMIGGPMGPMGPMDPMMGPMGGGGNLPFMPAGDMAPKFYFTAEYVLWFARSQQIDFPLITTGAPLSQGILGQPSTETLIGDRPIPYDVSSGFRFSGGLWADPERRFGVDVSGFMTERTTYDSLGGSDGNGIPVLARPYTDSNTGLPSSLLISFPSFAFGQFAVLSQNQVWGAEGSLSWNLYRSAPDACKGYSFTILNGYKHVNLKEGLDVLQRTNILPFNPFAFGGLTVVTPASLVIADRFKTTNEFHGYQIGFAKEIRWKRWHANMQAKVAVGTMQQQVDILGFSRIENIPGGGGSYAGGLLANPSNIGRFRHDEFAIVPEINLNLGYRLTERFTIFAGYNLIYMDHVIRPANLINPNVPSNLLPTSANFGLQGNTPVRTTPTFIDDSFFIQGVNFGFRWQY